MKAAEQQKEAYKAYYQKNKERWARYRKAPKTTFQNGLLEDIAKKVTEHLNA